MSATPPSSTASAPSPHSPPSAATSTPPDPAPPSHPPKPSNSPARLFYLVHSIHDLDLNPAAARIDVVVSGHSHHADISTRDGVHYLNPGSAGPHRFKLPVTLATITIANGVIGPRIITL
jgi:hypothetical protein